MGVYRNNFASLQGAFGSDSYLRWRQSAPTLNDLLLITSNQTGEQIKATPGVASLELLDGNPIDLDSPMKATYKSEKLLGGFILAGRSIVRVENGFNVIQFSDETPHSMMLLSNDVPVEHSIAWSTSGLILNGISTVLCERVLGNTTRANPEIQKLLDAV